jgi:hypothetical protein
VKIFKYGQMTGFGRCVESMKHRVVNFTERARLLATVPPTHGLKWKSPEGSWKEKVKVVDDLPKVDHASLWS